MGVFGPGGRRPVSETRRRVASRPQAEAGQRPGWAAQPVPSRDAMARTALSQARAAQAARPVISAAGRRRGRALRRPTRRDEAC